MIIKFYFVEFEKPLFKQSITSLSDLKSGTTVTGKVVNATHFGCFVDIGVGVDGLIHNSRMGALRQSSKNCLELGDRVEIVVENVEISRKRIGLKLLRLL